MMLVLKIAGGIALAPVLMTVIGYALVIPFVIIALIFNGIK